MLCRRPIAILLLVALLGSGTGAAGCTSMRPVQAVTAPGGQRFADIRIGDHVSFVSAGQHLRAVVASVDIDGFTSKAGTHYARADVTQLKRRSISKIKTTSLLIGIGFAVLVAFGIAYASAYDDILSGG
jgi:hypothetical protein